MTDIVPEIDTPQWDRAAKVHDWRNHVPEGVKAIWSGFTYRQKQQLYAWADALADAEDWD